MRDFFLNLKEGLIYFFCKVLIKLFRILPFSLTKALGKSAGYLFSFVPTKDRETALLQLKNFFPLPINALACTAKMYSNLGITIAEAVNIDKLLKNSNQNIILCDNGILEKIKRKRLPVIALTAHTGNWEFLAAYIAKQGIKLAAVAREANVGAYQKVLKELRKKWGIQVIWRMGKVSGVKSIKNLLNEGFVVAGLIDQDTKVASEFSLFFNHPCATPVGLVKIAKKSSCELVSAFIFRGKNHWIIRIEPLDTSLPEKEILDLFHKRLESYILIYPDQWIWLHRRWRTQKDGKRLSSKEYLKLLKESIN